jgi:hypothetical protein
MKVIIRQRKFAGNTRVCYKVIVKHNYGAIEQNTPDHANNLVGRYFAYEQALELANSFMVHKIVHG